MIKIEEPSGMAYALCLYDDWPMYVLIVYSQKHHRFSFGYVAEKTTWIEVLYGAIKINHVKSEEGFFPF